MAKGHVRGGHPSLSYRWQQIGDDDILEVPNGSNMQPEPRCMVMHDVNMAYGHITPTWRPVESDQLLREWRKSWLSIIGLTSHA